jgi:c-di-GMP-related signal transduction protein
MDQVNFIVREPLLDPKGKVLGYELCWHRHAVDVERGDVSGANSLIALVADQLNDVEGRWQFGDNLLFLKAAPAALAAEVIEKLPPKGIVFSVDAADFGDPAKVAAVKALREKGFGISLNVADLVKQDKALLPLFTHAEIRWGAADIATHTRIHGSLKQLSIRMVARQVNSWQEYDASAALGLDSFVGTLYLAPRPGNVAKGLNPAQAMILQLMQLVRQNADVKQLEGILRRDAALSYKLLRYINSVGFGLGTEIQSLRHAVTMLGYSPLYRWLSLLLATANTSGYAPALMQTAVIRGRFAELLGHGFLPKNEAENLFVAGMFSLLDRMLGIPMEQVLENIQLSDAVSQALISREGMYGPFLALAEACESGNARVSELADALFIGADRVNETHLSALAWAQSLKL